MGTGIFVGLRRYVPLLVIACCVGLVSIPGNVSAGQGALDGKTFAIDTGEKGKAADDKDTVTFRDGNLYSRGCDKYGFGEGAYTSTPDGDTIRFEAVTTSPTKGKITWKGAVHGDKIELSYVWVDAPHWYKRNPKPLEKWGKGELKR